MTTVNPTRLLMLDSGAFSVWTQGIDINLDDYIAFCLDHPDVSYYVNLDVIPGKPGDKTTLTREAVEAACQQGWENYQRMIAALPKSKVIHVFHQNDSIRWLEKYLEEGVPYIGISPANDRRTTGRNHRATLPGRDDPNTTKLQWIRSLKHLLFDGAGRPTCKTHGFAVTSFDLMKEMAWYSVDSASWKLVAAWGSIYVPRQVGGRWIFDDSPHLTTVSGVRTDIGLRDHDRLALSRIKRWLDEIDVPLGAFDVKTVSAGYKLDRPAKEIWFNKKKREVMVPTEKGVITAAEERLRCNAEVVKEANKVLPVTNIYFAGSLTPYPIEFELGRRLISFHGLSGNAADKYLRRHEELVRQHKEKKKGCHAS